MTFNITITEALAEIKTIGKRIEKKQQFIVQYLVRQEKMKDPLERDGGSFESIKRERQAIADLAKRAVDLRVAVHAASDKTNVTVGGHTKTISEWLIWRKEVAPQTKTFLGSIRQGIENVRRDAATKRLTVVSSPDAATKADDVIVNVNESELAVEIERMEEILGALDGQLSLKNATVLV